MLRSIGWSWFLVLAVVFAVGARTSAVGEPPISPAEQMIRQALDDELPAVGAEGSVLGDVLRVIQQRGSVLEGSSLDPRAEGEIVPSTAPKSERAYAAEQLLRASRLLEKLDDSDPRRSDLVNQMRAEAGKLLME